VRDPEPSTPPAPRVSEPQGEATPAESEAGAVADSSTSSEGEKAAHPPAPPAEELEKSEQDLHTLPENGRLAETASPAADVEVRVREIMLAPPGRTRLSFRMMEHSDGRFHIEATGPIDYIKGMVAAIPEGASR